MVRKLTPTELVEVRKTFVDIISKYNGKEPLKLDLDGVLLQQILFEVCSNVNEQKQFYIFWEPFKNNHIYEKLDFSNIPLDNVCLDEEDLSKYNGVKIDPQVIWNKSLVGTICRGVEFVGSFDDACIVATDFRGSRGAKIDPQKVRGQDFLMTQYNSGDIEFIGTFNNCVNMNYNSSRGR